MVKKPPHLAPTQTTSYHALMSESFILQGLNPEQKRAVTLGPQNALVLAGAGSGKTRVLTHRIAWLMQTQGISPFSILAVTFTNKAAREMQARIEQLYGMPLNSLWMGTFHGLSHRLLRLHWEKAGLIEHFQILDSDDQLRFIKRLHKDFDLDESKWPPKQTAWFINKCKEEGKRAADVNPGNQYFNEVMLKVYAAYEKLCEQSGMVDFTELLFRSLELLQNNADIREHYQNRFQYLLVDEFQDTNNLQYRWLSLLAGQHCCLMAVGDDDQSIYSWRGAKVENINRFAEDYAPAEIIRLEQNYRSTSTILDAANAVINNNQQRMGKSLWTNGAKGEPILLYAAFNERDEALFMINQIRQWQQQGNNYDEVAVLYRSNAQSRVLEEALINAAIPYRIYGGLKFFDRAEIKDAIAYLRLLANRDDDAAFERVINTPTRGIGQTTLGKVRELARETAISLWHAAKLMIDNGTLATRSQTCLQGFLDLIDQLDHESHDLTLGEQVEHILYRSHLMAHFQKDRSEQGQSRVENLNEFVGAAKQFASEDSELDLPPLSAFLTHIALESSEGQAEANSNCVSLMTLHAAKGLEFPLVFMVGMEENLFPHRMSIEENGLEEERRLCYVGMTRAMQKLIVTHAESRRLYGTEKYHMPSRFLQEIPDEFIEAVRPTARVQNTMAPQYARGVSSRFKQSDTTDTSIAGTSLRVGMQVKHPKFGAGTIINFEGRSEHARLQIKFERHGTKWLVASFAKLEVV